MAEPSLFSQLKQYPMERERFSKLVVDDLSFERSNLMKILVLNGSTRRHGNTELLAEKVTEGLSCTKIFLSEKKIDPIRDMRHTAEGFPDVEDDYEEVLQALLAHDTVVFATPLYWYGMSGNMKTCIDRWSQSLRDKRFSFKEIMSQKQAYVVIVGGDQPKVEALPLVQQFSLIFKYIGMTFAGYVIGKGNKPGEVLQDEAALDQAAAINRMLKEGAKK
jgi:multimeric flavodoxin WrbA